MKTSNLYINLANYFLFLYYKKMADEYDIQQSLLEQDEEFLMQNRQYTWIPDSNGGSYAAGSQIVIDGSPLANSGKYFSAANSFIQIPLVMTLQSVVGNLNNITSENDLLH